MVKLSNKLHNYLARQYPDSKFENEIFLSYTNVRDEYCALRHGIGLVDKSDRTILRMTGKETLDFIHRISTNSINNLSVDEKVNTLFLNEKGRFIDRATLVALENSYLLIGSSGTEDRLKYWIERYIIMEDIKVEPVENELALFEFYGDQAESFLTMICGKEIEYLDMQKILHISYEGVELKAMKFQEIGNTLKYWLLVKHTDSLKLVKQLFENASVFDLKLVGKDAYEIFRVEKGIPDFPNEINDLHNPHEVGLIGEVNFKKGCYIGQEVIARLDTYDKVQRKMIGFVNANHQPISSPVDLLDNENNDLGKISSIVNSELLRKQIGLALIKKKFINENELTTVATDENGTKLNLKLAELPFKK